VGGTEGLEKRKSYSGFYHIDEGGDIQELLFKKHDPTLLNKFFPEVDSSKTVITANHIPKDIVYITLAPAVLCF
jgi:hypothetical protein